MKQIIIQIINSLENNWKKYLPWVLVIVLAIIYFKVDRTNNRTYKNEMKIKNDSIATLNKGYAALEDLLGATQELGRMALYDMNAYKDSFHRIGNRNRNLIYYYEAELTILRNTPTDTLYRDITGWLDSLSFN